MGETETFRAGPPGRDGSAGPPGRDGSAGPTGDDASGGTGRTGGDDRGAPLPARAAALARTHPEPVAAAVALVLIAWYLASGLMGGDLSAQLARADFARAHPLTPVDLRWFGGFLPFDYSLWTPWLMAVLGARLTGAVATVAATWLTTRLLRTSGTRRPLAGGVLAAVTLTSNLVEGRVTFACGVVCGLGALTLLRHRTGRARAGVAVLSALAGAASPVAALLLAVCAVALLARRRVLDAALVCGPAVVLGAALSLAFSDPGRGLISRADVEHAVAVSVLLLLVAPRGSRVLRVGALAGIAVVLVVGAVDTPIGVSAVRLTLLFAVPVVAAVTVGRRWQVLLVVALAVLAQSPVTFGTLAKAGRPATTAAYYRPLLDELAARGPLTGRVEVPELTGHWEAVFLARHVPISRGWIRQTDTGQNDAVFYRGRPTAATYRAFLDRTATEYVAVADAEATYAGAPEERLVQAGLPYLDPVWSSTHWTLYRVRDAVPLVDAPGRLVAQDADSVTVDVPAGSAVTVRVRWFRWLSLDAHGARACLDRSGDVAVVRATTGGRVVLSSTFAPGRGQC